ncbi:MAG: hypothetical protein AUJ39_01575 [Parcubacteria group bacterium CG1_02_42_13]|uniref:AB hydrolase-1 domain-containing protein n=1 Tax=Candidatus Portnoybacteria bacterium CG02_land_8_20_14_3_00_45_8 TaxID=1974807 RepID=A0A2M7D6G7_9BACT|nr:MAG: hypothetical protein AUJ39_01575 [Parcubacteria group bacterium CG1_02_42_13]PIV38616.1 MAG: hypothetical protein COS30_01120 [Candidatus Portnoybacteria bacterium CG02_land_8_20_14_3_00_45_8]HCX28026.1 hypothetical protein [Candidatus Portnoybacteria bacterium]
MTDFHLPKKSIDTQNGKIFYWLGNSFPGRPFVILLHGLSSNHTTWLSTINVLHANHYNSLAPDLRGHGFSDKTKQRDLYALNVFSRDLQEILVAEQIKNFVLIGYSFGGQVAVDFTARYQGCAKGLILISTNIAPPLKYLKLNFFTSIVVAGLNFLAMLLFWQKRRNYHYYEHGRAVGYWDSVWDGLRTMPLAVNLWLLAQAFKADLRNAIKQIKIPATLFYGQNDAYIAKKEINDTAKALPQAQLIISKNQGHFIGTNSQAETARIILNFLKNCENSDF